MSQLKDDILPSENLETSSIEKPLGPAGGKNKTEIKRLAGRPPLQTLLFLMIGPVISQLTNALYGVLNQIWVTKALGNDGMAAVGVEITFEYFGRAFGFFMMIASSTQISHLFGAHLFEDASQVMCDILRTACVCGLIVPALILPIHKPLVKWFKTSDEIAKLGFHYLEPICYGSICTCLNLGSQGVLQAEGRTLLVGAIDFITLIFACLGCTPLCLFVFKTGICGAGLAQILADGLSALFILICYFKGVFGVKPQLKQLLKRFSPHSWKAIFVGSSQLIANLSNTVPGIPLRNLIGRDVASDDEYTYAMAGFTVICRFFQIVIAVLIAICTGFIPPAAFANAMGNYKRYLKLTFHALWIGFVWCFILNILTYACPEEIAKIFAQDDKEYLKISGDMLKHAFGTGLLNVFRFVPQAMMQALQKGGQAMIISLMCQFVSIIGFSYLMFYIYPYDVVKLMDLYFWQTAFSMLFACCFLIYPLYKLTKMSQTQTVPEQMHIDEQSELNSSLLSESANGSSLSTLDNSNKLL